MTLMPFFFSSASLPLMPSAAALSIIPLWGIAASLLDGFFISVENLLLDPFQGINLSKSNEYVVLKGA
jgi:hypothetical protein